MTFENEVAVTKLQLLSTLTNGRRHRILIPLFLYRPGTQWLVHPTKTLVMRVVEKITFHSNPFWGVCIEMNQQACYELGACGLLEVLRPKCFCVELQPFIEVRMMMLMHSHELYRLLFIAPTADNHLGYERVD